MSWWLVENQNDKSQVTRYPLSFLKSLIIANWKANPSVLNEAVLLARAIEQGISRPRRVTVVVAPPFLFLEQAGAALKKAKLGAQDMFWADGPYTGEVSPGELRRMGVRYVIIGHSERRIHLGETDEMVNKKVNAALNHGLVPVLCVGERERNNDEIPPLVGAQLKNALAGISRRMVPALVVAYEPVWAISTNPGARADTPDNAFRAKIYIRKILAGIYGRKTADCVRIIYGGSVGAENAGGFFVEGGMDGALVGGASLRPNEFEKIVASAAR